MTAALLIAMLLQTGACKQTEFNSSDGGRLAVVVCQMQAPTGERPPKPEAPPTWRGRRS